MADALVENDPFLQGSQTLELEEFESMASRGLEEAKPAEAPPEGEADAPIEEVAPEETAATEEAEEELAPVDVEEDEARAKADIAENRRLRKQRNEANEKNRVLEQRLAKLEGRMDERSKGEPTIDEQLAAATDAQLLDAKKSLELDMFEAIEARDKERYQRALNGKAIIEAQQQARLKPQVTDTVAEAKAQFMQVHDSIQELYPDALDKTSAFGKAVLSFNEQNKALMQNLGPLGELVAVASVIATKPELLKGKKTALATERLETGINRVVQNAVSKGKTRTPSRTSGIPVPKSIDGVKDLMEKIKSGAVSFEQLQ